MAPTDATFGEEPAEITRESDAFEQWLAAENRGNERLNSRTVQEGDLIDIAVPEYVADAAETDVSYLLNAEVTGIWGRWDDDDTATDIKFQCGDWRGTVYTDRTHWKVSFSHPNADYIPDGEFDGGWFVETESAENGVITVPSIDESLESDELTDQILKTDFKCGSTVVRRRNGPFPSLKEFDGCPFCGCETGWEYYAESGDSTVFCDSAESGDSDSDVMTDGGIDKSDMNPEKLDTMMQEASDIEYRESGQMARENAESESIESEDSGPVPTADMCDVCGIETDGDVCDGCESSLIPFAESQNTDGRAYTVTAVSDETHLNERTVEIQCDSGQTYVFRMLPGDKSPRFDHRENADGSIDSSVSSYPQNVENVRDAVFADDTDESHNSAAIKFARNRIESEGSAEDTAETTISDVIDRITRRNKQEYDSLESKDLGRFGRPDNPVRSPEERKRVTRVTRRSIENSRQPDLGAKALGAFLSDSADDATYDTADGRKVACDGGMAVESPETDTAETDTADGPISSPAMAEILRDFGSVRDANIDVGDVGIWVFGHEDSMLYGRVFDAVRSNGWKVEWVSSSYNESPYCKVTPDR